MSDGSNFVGTAAIKITADASDFQTELKSQIDAAIQALQADLKVGLSLVSTAGGSGKVEGPSGTDDSSVSSVVGIEERQAGTGSSHNLAFNVAGVRAAIEEALKAPFIIRFEAQRVSGSGPAIESQLQETQGGRASARVAVSDEAAGIIQGNTDLSKSLEAFHQVVASVWERAGKSMPSGIGSGDQGRVIEKVGDLIEVLGTSDPKQWIGAFRDKLATDIGLDQPARKEVLNNQGVTGLLMPVHGSEGEIYKAQGFSEALARSTVSSKSPAYEAAVPAARPIESVRMGAPLSELAAAAASIGALVENADPDRAERHASRKAKRDARQAFADTITSVHFGRGVETPGPYTGTYERPPGEEVAEEQRVLTPAERAQRATWLRRMSGIRQNLVPRGHKRFEAQQAALKEGQEWLDSHREGLSRSGVGPNVTSSTGFIPATEGISEGRGTLGDGLTGGRDPGRRRSPDLSEAGKIQIQLRGTLEEYQRREAARAADPSKNKGGPGGIIGRIADLEDLVGQPGGPTIEEMGALRAQRSFLESRIAVRTPAKVEIGPPELGSLNDPELIAQQNEDRRKAHGDLVKGGGGGRVSGPGISSNAKAQIDSYSDARLRDSSGGVDIDLAPFVREVQRGGSSPWFGLASGEGGAFQIPAVNPGEENLPYGEILAREQRIRELSESKMPFDLPGVSEVGGKVVPLSRKEAILRMAQDQIGGGTPASPGGDPATRDLVAEVFKKADTAINAALSAKLPGPNADFAGDTANRSRTPQQQARLDLDLANALNAQREAEARALRYHSLQDDIDQVTGARAGRRDDDKTEALYQKAEADAKRHANRAEQLWALGAQPITGSVADAQRMGRVDRAIGALTRPMIEGDHNAEAYGDTRPTPRQAGVKARKTLANWFGLPSIAFDEGADSAQINKAERDQMRDVLTTQLTAPFTERMAVAEHRPVPDPQAKISDPVTGELRQDPTALRPETLFELSKRVWDEVTEPIEELLKQIPSDDKEGRKVANQVRGTLKAFHRDLYGTLKFLDDTNDEYETTREMASNYGGGRSVRRNQGAGAGAMGSGGRGASAEMMNRSRVSTFFQQAQIPITSLDKEFFEARDAREKVRKTLPTYSTDPSTLTTQEARDKDTENMRVRQAGLAKMYEEIPLPNVNLIRSMAKELVDSVVAEIGGSPDRQAVSSAISARPTPVEPMAVRARQEALEALETHDPSNMFATFGEGIIGAGSAGFGGRPGGYTVLAPATRDTSLDVVGGNDLRRGRMKRDGTLVGQPPETATGADLGYEAPEFFVPGAEPVAARRAEIDAQLESIKAEKHTINTTPYTDQAESIGQAARYRELQEQERSLWEERTAIAAPVRLNPVPGEKSTEDLGETAQAAVEGFRQREMARQMADGGAAGGGSDGGGDATAQQPSGRGVLHVWVDNPMPWRVIGGGGSGEAGGGATPRGQAAWARAEAQYATAPRMLQFAQRMIDRAKEEKPGVSDRALHGMLSASGLQAAAELLLRDEMTTSGGGGGGSAAGPRSRNARRERLGLDPLEGKDQTYFDDMNSADDTRANLSARARRAARGIPSRGFSASMTDMFANLGGFLDKQIASVARFQTEGGQLATMERRMPRLEFAQRTASEEYEAAQSKQAEAKAAVEAGVARKAPKAEMKPLRDALSLFSKDVISTKTAFENADLALNDALQELGESDLDDQGNQIVNPDGSKKRATGQYLRVKNAEDQLPSTGERVAAFGIGAAANVATVAIGNMLAMVGMAGVQAVSTIINDVMVKEVLDPAIERFTGFQKALSASTDLIAESSRATSANIEATVASTAAQVGFSDSAYSWLQSTIGQRGMIEAGNKIFMEQTTLSRGAEEAQNSARRGREGEATGWYQPPGGIPGLTRNTGGFLGSPLFGTKSTWEQIQDETPVNRMLSSAGSAFLTSIGSLTGAPLGNPGGMDAVVDDFVSSVDFSRARLDELGQAAKRGGSDLVFLGNASDEQKRAFEEAADRLGIESESFTMQGLAVGRTGADADPLTSKDLEKFLLAMNKGLQMASPDAMLEALRGREGSSWRDQIEAESQLQLRSNSASFGMNWLAAPPVRLEDAMFPGGLNAGTGQANLGSSYAGDFSSTALINPSGFTIPQEVFDSYNKFLPLAEEVFGEVDRLAKEGVSELKGFGLSDEQIAKIVSYGSAIKDLQEDIAGQQWAAGIEDYNYSLGIAKRTLGDLVGLNDKSNASLANGTKVYATNLGMQQRIVLEKSRELTLLGQGLQQRQINFQMATAGFGTEGLTSAEIAARRRQAQYEAKIAQKQLDLQKDITSAEFKIVDEQNLRALKESIHSIDKMVRDFRIQVSIRGEQALIQALQGLRSKVLADADVTVGKYKTMEQQAIATAAAMRKLTDESFTDLLNRAKKTISEIKSDLANAYDVASGKEDEGDDGRARGGSYADDQDNGRARGGSWADDQDTGGPGAFTPSSMGTGSVSAYSGPLVQFGDVTVRSEADLEAIGAIVEKYLNRQSALRGLRTPVVF